MFSVCCTDWSLERRVFDGEDGRKSGGEGMEKGEEEEGGRGGVDMETTREAELSMV